MLHASHLALRAAALLLAAAPLVSAAPLRALDPAASRAPSTKEALRDAAWTRRLAPEAVTAAAAGSGLDLASASVTLALDPFGSFGHATAGGDAFFHDGTRRAATVFEYLPHVKGVGFLDSTALVRPGATANARHENGAVVADYTAGSFRFEVSSRLEDCALPDCAVLEQRWRVTNASSAPAPLVMTFYLDGDLFFSGAYNNDYGALVDGVLYQFDAGSDPRSPSTFLGLTGEAPSARSSVREVGEYVDQRRRLARGQALAERLLRSSGAAADRDGDGVTDAGFDVSLALQHDLGTLAPGASAELVSRVQWGVGTLADLAELPVADAGPDRVVECEGQAGTAVTLDGRASTPADLVAWRWTVDGAPAGEGPSLEVVLLPGPHDVLLQVEDAQGRTAEDAALVVVQDTTSPVVEPAAPVSLWPPNHRLVRVDVAAHVVDACSAATTLRVVEVTCDEADDVRRGGDGMTLGDAVLGPDGAVYLRAERQGGGDGRVYRVHAEALDETGNATSFAVEFHCPHSPGKPAVDSGTAVRTAPSR